MSWLTATRTRHFSGVAILWVLAATNISRYEHQCCALYLVPWGNFFWRAETQ